MIHDFKESLAWSHKQEDDPAWAKCYAYYFGSECVMKSNRNDMRAQRLGIDRIVTANGREYTIDEKVRRKDYGDILLEQWSDESKQIKGWACKPLHCDYIAYMILESSMCYLFDTLELQRAYAANVTKWQARFGTRRAVNASWVTVSVPIPYAELIAAIEKTRVFCFAEKEITTFDISKTLGKWWCSKARQGHGARLDKYEKGVVTVRLSGPGQPMGQDRVMQASDFLKSYIYVTP